MKRDDAALVKESRVAFLTVRLRCNGEAFVQGKPTLTAVVRASRS